MVDTMPTEIKTHPDATSYGQKVAMYQITGGGLSTIQNGDVLSGNTRIVFITRIGTNYLGILHKLVLERRVPPAAWSKVGGWIWRPILAISDKLVGASRTEGELAGLQLNVPFLFTGGKVLYTSKIFLGTGKTPSERNAFRFRLFRDTSTISTKVTWQEFDNAGLLLEAGKLTISVDKAVIGPGDTVVFSGYGPPGQTVYLRDKDQIGGTRDIGKVVVGPMGSWSLTLSIWDPNWVGSSMRVYAASGKMETGYLTISFIAEKVPGAVAAEFLKAVGPWVLGIMAVGVGVHTLAKELTKRRR